MNGVAIGKQAVVSFSPTASQVGASILKNGGNAIDAAVATSLTLGVVEPGWNGIGGGGFILAYLSSGDRVVIDYRETAPLKTDPSYYVDEEKASIGYGAIGVPGTVAGLFHLHENYGKKSLREVMRHTIEYALKGIRVSELWANSMRNNLDRSLEKIKMHPSSSKVFLKNGDYYYSGELFVQKDLAQTLEILVEEGAEAFYRGYLAELIEKDISENGGFLTGEDLRKYEIKVKTPIEVEYGKFKIVTMPPPGSGACLIEALNILDALLEIKPELNYQQFLAEVLAFVMNDRASYICDPDFHKVPVSMLIDYKYAENVAEKILSGMQIPNSCSSERGTAHISVIDEEGNAVSLTETLECFMGSGVEIRGTGILMNDEIHDFTFDLSSVNYIQPKKRPRSSMSPTIILRNDEPFLILGASGGTRILTSLVQVLFYRLKLGFNLVRAVHCPRIHVQDGEVFFEQGINNVVSKYLSQRGYILETKREFSPVIDGCDIYYGAIEAIEVLDKKRVLAVSDPRKYYGAMAIE